MVTQGYLEWHSCHGDPQMKVYSMRSAKGQHLIFIKHRGEWVEEVRLGPIHRKDPIGFPFGRAFNVQAKWDRRPMKVDPKEEISSVLGRDGGSGCGVRWVEGQIVKVIWDGDAKMEICRSQSVGRPCNGPRLGHFGKVEFDR